jgi:hypothetical protein
MLKVNNARAFLKNIGVMQTNMNALSHEERNWISNADTILKESGSSWPGIMKWYSNNRFYFRHLDAESTRPFSGKLVVICRGDLLFITRIMRIPDIFYENPCLLTDSGFERRHSRMKGEDGDYYREVRTIPGAFALQTHFDEFVHQPFSYFRYPFPILWTLNDEFSERRLRNMARNTVRNTVRHVTRLPIQAIRHLSRAASGAFRSASGVVRAVSRGVSRALTNRGGTRRR